LWIVVTTLVKVTILIDNKNILHIIKSQIDGEK